MSDESRKAPRRMYMAPRVRLLGSVPTLTKGGSSAGSDGFAGLGG